jgi:hypothetical protein
MHSYLVDVRAFNFYSCGHMESQAQPSAEKCLHIKKAIVQRKESSMHSLNWEPLNNSD